MAKKNRDLFLKAGLKGFVCTCNGMEKQCIRESYNILNEYADKLYGEEQVIDKLHNLQVGIHRSVLIISNVVAENS